MRVGTRSCSIGAMESKKFRLQPHEIHPVAKGYGACFATDMITVHGHRVGFMYKEEPDNDVDSGWRFLAGTESQQYLDDPNNTGIYEVNTIANYDPSIVPLLDSPVGAAFAIDLGTGRLAPVAREPEEEG